MSPCIMVRARNVGLRVSVTALSAVAAVTSVTAASAVAAMTAMTAMTAVPAMTQVHGDHPADDQDPDPVGAEELQHHDSLTCRVLPDCPASVEDR